MDDNRRALLEVRIRPDAKGEATVLESWVDTAFDGHFVFSASLIEDLGFDTLVETEAILADGRKVTLETFVAYLEWFGTLVPVQVVSNEGKFPLLGTELLASRRLTIDDASETVELV